jgi:hypothetical protein
MFTIKNMEDGGYTAYECSYYSVQWKPGAPPQITLYGDAPCDPGYLSVEHNAYIMNDAGKTIDRVSYSTPESEPLSKLPSIQDVRGILCDDGVGGTP